MKIDKIRQSDIEKLLVRLRQRSSEELEEVSESVRSIIKEVRAKGIGLSLNIRKNTTASRSTGLK
jgi:4-aminobutyrate aminotransferase-like enzyme